MSIKYPSLLTCSFHSLHRCMLHHMVTGVMCLHVSVSVSVCVCVFIRCGWVALADLRGLAMTNVCCWTVGGGAWHVLPTGTFGNSARLGET